MPPKPAVNEISSPTSYTDTDYIVLHYIIQFLC